MLVPCISIKQPWAWLLCHQSDPAPMPGKDIENRDWVPRFEDRRLLTFPMRVLIHAGRIPDSWCFNSFSGKFLMDRVTINEQPVKSWLPPNFPTEQGGGWHRDHAGCGGIVGIATLTRVVRRSDSPWFIPGKVGLKFKDAMPLPFFQLDGKPGFWEIDDQAPLHKYPFHYGESQPLHWTRPHEGEYESLAGFWGRLIGQGRWDWWG